MQSFAGNPCTHVCTGITLQAEIEQLSLAAVFSERASDDRMYNGFPVFAMQTRHVMSVSLLKMSRASGMEASLLCVWFPAQSEPGIQSSI